MKQYSLHDDSSDPSVQSLLPSHIHANGIHSPLLLRHVKSSDEQTFVSALFDGREMIFKIVLVNLGIPFGAFSLSIQFMHEKSFRHK